MAADAVTCMCIFQHPVTANKLQQNAHRCLC